MSLPTFTFDHYTLRPAIVADLPMAKRWNDADPDHKDRTPALFWITQTNETNSFVLEDAQGVVFFSRCSCRAILRSRFTWSLHPPRRYRAGALCGR